jgi:hypothetical protein
MNIIRVYLYTCRYANTFFITVVAVDSTQATAMFEEFLTTHAAWPTGQKVDHARMHVKRQNTTRGVYAYYG